MRSRLFCSGAVLLLCATAAAAQDGLRSASLPERTPQQPIPPTRVDQFAAPRFVFEPRLDPHRRHHRRDDFYPFPYGYGVGYGVPYPPELYTPDRRGSEAMEPTGYLHFEMQPGTAEVHVDGVYLGTVDDFRRVIPGRAIEAGPHRVELRAPGYETVTLSVRVFPNETTTYRTDLRPQQSSEPPARIAPGRPKTFYVIPGCYAGDKPPRAARLAPGCDASRVRRIPPQPAAAPPAADRRG
jgi:hypothetical protein